GDVSFFERDLERRTGRDVAVIADAERPVPLTFEYSVEPIQDLLVRLVQQDRAPVYVVHFAQKDAVERAQSLTSVNVASRERRAEIAEAIGDFRFSKGFGQTLSRLLRLGIGVHHAGMLPRYRRLVERLTQAGLLAVVCGTDTLGVGINVPIRTVVLTSLTKFDGERSRHLTAREFHQIAGRAGRAGYDTTGEVIVQAPEHVIENAKALAKAGDDERKRRKIVRKKAPAGAVNWTDKTLERLRDADPEPLTSQFHVTHTMVLSVLARPGDPVQTMYRLLTDNHEPPTPWNPHLRRAVEIYRSLRTAGVVEHADAEWRRADPGKPDVWLTVDLPREGALRTTRGAASTPTPRGAAPTRARRTCGSPWTGRGSSRSTPRSRRSRWPPSPCSTRTPRSSRSTSSPSSRPPWRTRARCSTPSSATPAGRPSPR